jgi:small subunit ribosomal protein S2
MTVITLKDLLDAGVHFGHQSSRWNPRMFPYIYKEQNGIHVIDLVQTARLLTYAYEYVRVAAKEKKTFLFVGTKRQASNIIEEEAKKCNAFYVNNRWLGGILTNWSTVQARVEYLKELDVKEESGEIGRLPKKRSSSIT